MDGERIRGLCPKCGKELEIPGDLAEFSCLYCGARLKSEELTSHDVPRVQACEDPEGTFQSGVEGLVRAVTAYPRIMNHMTRTEFDPFFETYAQENRGAVAQLNLAAQGAYEAGARRAAEAFLEGLNRHLAEHHKAMTPKDVEREEAKFALCLFLVPMIRREGLEISEPLAAALREAWMKAYPKSPFELTTYEDLMAGFRRKKLCFITTAVTESQGKPDDCPELTAFRAFRDGYLMGCPDGEGLILEYYDIAPGIVSAISLAGEPGTFQGIWDRYLAPCYEDILAGRNESCKKTYTEMVQALKGKYLKL